MEKWAKTTEMPLLSQLGGPGGLGAYLTLAAMFACAKARKRRGGESTPRYRGIVCSIAHETRAGVDAVEKERNHKLFKALGGKHVRTVFRGSTQDDFIEEGDDAPRHYLALTGDAHKWIPLDKMKQRLRLPTGPDDGVLNEICPLEPRTGRSRCR